jgi:VanZ family protein
MKITIKSFWPAVVWLILSSIAFCLPGSALPSGGLFNIPQFDKVVHIVLFSVMIFLWCLPLSHRQSASQILTKLFIRVSIGFFCYGVLMEFIQHFFVPLRSFDMGDIAADAAGCLIGFFFTKRQQRLQVK